MSQVDATSAAVPAEVIARECVLLAPYAMHSQHTAGRTHAEPPHPFRGPYQRDRDRITHSAAFRRLSDKMQVFTGQMGDYHRTRLTHTLEVAGLARTLGRALKLNEDLIEALALAHDLGHPPFGHAGEAVLHECLLGHGGFNHNRHGLRILEHLERRWTDFPGLNLSHEVLEGQTARILKTTAPHRPLLEVQVVDAADSVAYDAHDADDALQLGLLTFSDLQAIPLWRSATQRVRRRTAAASDDELRRAVVHELIDWQATDLLAHTQQLLESSDVSTLADVRRLPTLVQASPEMAEQKAELERFLFSRVYRHPTVMQHCRTAQTMLRQMYTMLVEHPDLLPADYQQTIFDLGIPRTVCDYLASMTDRHAQAEFQRLLHGTTT